MSVMIPSSIVFDYTYAGLLKTAYHSGQVDEFYAYKTTRHFKENDPAIEAKRFMKSLIELNELSYCIKYASHGEKYQNQAEKWKPKSIDDINPCQLLKYITCIGYNIELDTIEDLQEVTDQQYMDVELLKQWKLELRSAIIEQLPEYKQAKWCD